MATQFYDASYGEKNTIEKRKQVDLLVKNIKIQSLIAKYSLNTN